MTQTRASRTNWVRSMPPSPTLSLATSNPVSYQGIFAFDTSREKKMGRGGGGELGRNRKRVVWFFLFLLIFSIACDRAPFPLSPLPLYLSVCVLRTTHSHACLLSLARAQAVGVHRIEHLEKRQRGDAHRSTQHTRTPRKHGEAGS